MGILQLLHWQLFPLSVLAVCATLVTCFLNILSCFCQQKVVSVWIKILIACVLDIFENSTHWKNKTAELAQRTPRDAPNIWVPWKVLRVLTTHPATFPEICSRLLLRSILRMCLQKLKFLVLPVPEIIGVLKKIGQSLDMPTLHFLSKF